MRAISDPDRITEGTRASQILARIAVALSVPTSVFFAPDAHPAEIEAHEQAVLLDLVRRYLDRTDPEARSRFVEALRTLA